MYSGRVDPGIIPELQRQTRNIRNICVLAHVDHGKVGEYYFVCGFVLFIYLFHLSFRTIDKLI